MASKIQSVKGTREFYPEQMSLRNFIYEKVRAASQAFGYQEWDAPFIETIDLYAAKSGEELSRSNHLLFKTAAEILLLCALNLRQAWRA
jgi:histidyl-tRNA synthetase